MKKYLGLLLILILVLGISCQKKEEAQEAAEPQGEVEEAPAAIEESDNITVQHILISFNEGGVPDVTRTLEEAEVLAKEILARIEAGEDFDALVKEYTDDAYPGIYKMSNFDVPDDPEDDIYPRERMVKAFGDVGFSLAVGEVGMTEYSPEESKYGFHIIKRLE